MVRTMLDRQVTQAGSDFDMHEFATSFLPGEKEREAHQALRLVQKRRANAADNTLLETVFSQCVSNFPECFSSNPHGNSPILVSSKKTHRETTKHTGTYTFSCRLRKYTRGNFCTHREIQLFPCRLQKNRRGNFRTHREIHRFLVGCRKTNREIYIHTGKFMNSQ